MNDDDKQLQDKIVKSWKAFSHTAGYEDLMRYIDDMREMYRKYAEERAMPHPNGKETVPLDNETVAALLQNSRGLNIVKTYIELRVNTDDVVRPKQDK